MVSRPVYGESSGAEFESDRLLDLENPQEDSEAAVSEHIVFSGDRYVHAAILFECIEWKPTEH